MVLKTFPNCLGLTKGSCTSENPTAAPRLNKVLANYPTAMPGFHPPLPPKPAVPPRTSSVYSRTTSEEIVTDDDRGSVLSTCPDNLTPSSTSSTCTMTESLHGAIGIGGTINSAGE